MSATPPIGATPNLWIIGVWSYSFGNRTACKIPEPQDNPFWEKSNRIGGEREKGPVNSGHYVLPAMCCAYTSLRPTAGLKTFTSTTATFAIYLVQVYEWLCLCCMLYVVANNVCQYPCAPWWLGNGLSKRLMTHTGVIHGARLIDTQIKHTQTD